MSITILETKPAKADEWDSVWQTCHYSTYFHSREWAEIWETYTNGSLTPAPLQVTFSDGSHAILTLSYSKSCKGLIKSYVSSPGGTYGGWISEDDLSIEHINLLTQYLIKTFANLTWRINPYDKMTMKSGVEPSKADETHAINLENGFDFIYKKWTKGHSSAARKARKAGVIVKPATTLSDWRAYYQIYEDSLRRWGDKASSQYRWELFSEMFQRNSQAIKLWLAVYQDKVVAGALNFYARQHVVYWHGAALEEYFSVRPVNLLMYEVIKDACEKRYAWFDFNPSGGHEGVKAFKKSFGADVLQCPVVNITTTCLKALRVLALVRIN